MSTYKPTNSRNDFIDYCLRKLGHPVIEINVDDDQIEDRVNDALRMFMEYTGEGSYRIYHPITITSDMITAGKIDFSTDLGGALSDSHILSVIRVLPINNSASGSGMFDVQYQMRLNDMYDLTSGMQGIQYFEQMQQYVSLLDMKLNGTPQIQFDRYGASLEIFGDLNENGDLKEGDKILMEAWVGRDGDGSGKVWDNTFLKEYATSLIKEQWGQNLIKFDGMTLPGGVQLNGRQILEDAKQEIEVTRQRLYNEYDTPPDFFVG